MKKIFLFLIFISIFIFSGCAGGTHYRSIKEIKRSGELHVYVFPAGKPFAYLDGNIPVGSEVELMEKVAQDLGVSAVFTVATRAEIFEAIQNGAADVAVGNFIDTVSSRRVASFSAGMGSQGMYSVAKRGEIYNTCGTFLEKNIGAVEDSASDYSLIISPVRPTEIYYYENVRDLTTALLFGEIDVLVCSEQEAAEIIFEHDELAAEYVTNSAVSEFSAMVARGNTNLIAAVNKIIFARE